MIVSLSNAQHLTVPAWRKITDSLAERRGGILHDIILHPIVLHPIVLPHSATKMRLIRQNYEEQNYGQT